MSLEILCGQRSAYREFLFWMSHSEQQRLGLFTLSEPCVTESTGGSHYTLDWVASLSLRNFEPNHSCTIYIFVCVSGAGRRWGDGRYISLWGFGFSPTCGPAVILKVQKTRTLPFIYDLETEVGRLMTLIWPKTNSQIIVWSSFINIFKWWALFHYSWNNLGCLHLLTQRDCEEVIDWCLLLH